MAKAQPRREKTWLEKLEEFLTDEFHYELNRNITETLWRDVLVGDWTDQLQFFACLRAQHDYISADQSRPAHIRSHLQLLNFSGKDLSGGEVKQWLADQLPKNRQNILLLHALRLILENRDQKNVNVSLVVPIIRREIHQCMRLVFYHLSNGPHAKGLDDLANEITQFEWLPINDVRKRLENHLVSWLEAEGVDGADVDSSIKLRKFWERLNRFVHSRPGITDSVEFKYGHLFSDWQKFGFCTTMIYEIGRLGCLVSLEALSHSSTSSVTADLVNQPLAERRMKGGTHYQNQLAIHYLLKALNANENNTKKATFASFLTGFSENTLRQNWSNIHRKSDEKDIGWENDLRAVRAHCVDLGLTEVVNLIDADLGSQNE